MKKLLLLPILLLAGCAKQVKFNKTKLNTIKNSQNFNVQAENSGVEVGVKVLTRQDTIETFDYDLHKHSIYPIMLNFNNTTDKAYWWTYKSMDGIKLIDSKSMFNILTLGYGKIQPMKIPGLIYGITVIPTTILLATFGPYILYLDLLFPSFALLQLTAFTSGIWLLGDAIHYSSDIVMNKSLYNMLHNNNPTKIHTLKPNSELSLMFFAKTEPKEFNIKLYPRRGNFRRPVIEIPVSLQAQIA